MAKNKSPTAEIAPPEPPSPSAELTIKLGPAELAKGKVPAEQARHLITTFGIVACVCAGIGGAVLTLRTFSAPVALAFGELLVALAAAALIAICGRGPVHRTKDRGNQ
jgi:hypothetical protein